MISGLYTLHSYGIIHRDIKNANTLIYERNDGKNILKIIDFGLSKVMGVNEYANEGYGSLPYKSPEQLLGKKYSFPVDIWALGITIYWLVYGHFPVSAETKHKMKKLIVKYEYKVNNENDKIVGNESFFYNKILTHTLINDYRKRVNILELMKYKELIY
jgi:calcium/calmodulin-dependent protein kinase I